MNSTAPAKRRGRPPRKTPVERLNLKLGLPAKRKLYDIANANGMSMRAVLELLILGAPTDVRLSLIPEAEAA